MTKDEGLSVGQPINNPRIAFLANPNSPSGTCLTPEQIRAVAADLPCPLLIDEAYVDFAETDCVELVRGSVGLRA